MSIIIVNPKVINEETQKLRKAKNTFKPYLNSFIKNSTEELNQMDSRFTKIMEKTINNLKNDMNTQILKNIDAYINKVENVGTTFSSVDENNASANKGFKR